MTLLVPVAVSPLRQRLIDGMEVCRFGHETQRNYIRDVGRFATYGLLFQAAAQTITTVADDPRHLGAAYLRPAMPPPARPHGCARRRSPARWPLHLLAPSVPPADVRAGKLFRRPFLTRLTPLHEAGRLAFLRHLAPVSKRRWGVYAKPPFAEPETVLAYLSRYIHRVAIATSRLMRFGQTGVVFRYKDYRRAGTDQRQDMALAADELTRRFLFHVLPKGVHRLRHYGLLANGIARSCSSAK